LITTTRGFARETVNETQCGIYLGRRQTSGGKSSPVNGSEIVRGTENRDAGEIAFLLVVTKKEEGFVFHNGSAYSPTELVPHIFRLQRDASRNAIDELGNKAIRISRAPLVVTIEKESGTVELVSAGLGDGIDDAAGRTAILGREI
jgi:hypothetical protein